MLERRAVSGLVLTLLLTSMLTLAFNFQPVKASGTIYIKADGSVEGTTHITSVDNITYTFTNNIYDSIVVEKDNIVVDGAGYTLQGTGSGLGIYLFRRSNVTVRNVKIKSFDWGMRLIGGSNNTFSGNNITENNSRGITLSESSNNTLFGNHITNNDFGINLYSSSNNTLSGNHITNNRYGIRLRNYNSDNIFSGNNITNNGEGISLSYSLNNIFSGNNIRNNWSGIYLYYSPHSILCENNITDNDFGIYLKGAPSHNSIYHNNLMDNIQQIYFSTSGYANSWDDSYPSGGNYWSDHVTVDDYSGINQDEPDRDGIVDTPYLIDGNNQDNYPLMNPWTSIDREVGVKIGSWVKYSNFDVTWSSDDPNLEMPLGIAILSEIEWLENSVETVLGTKIKYQQLLHLKDGSEIATTCWIDVETASGTPLSFISSGLDQGDCLYESAPWFTWKINETISCIYLGVLREVNLLNITTSMQIGPPPPYPNTTGNFYWDKETGILCELSMKHINETGNYVTSWSVSYEIVDTNLWESPSVPATINIDPDTLNLRSKGKWITAYIELPEGYHPEDIDATTILINETISPVLDPKYEFATNLSEYLVDHNEDGILERMVKFDRAEVMALLSVGEATLTITGEVNGTPFEGSDSIRVILPSPGCGGCRGFKR